MSRKVWKILVVALVLAMAHAPSTVLAQEKRLMFSLQANPQELKPSVCDIFDATYKPYTSYQNKNFDYSIHVEKMDCTPPSCPSANIILTLHDKNFHSVLSTVTMKYGCSGGSFIHCVAGFANQSSDNSHKERDRITFDITALTSDWSPSDLMDKQAPYALIFPAMNETFRFIDWEQFTDSIHYFTPERVAPNAATPNLWILKQCVNQTEPKGK